jgi:hypothetical protein
MDSIPAAAIAVTVGVDTHLDHHVAAVIDPRGRRCATPAFSASTRGDVALVTWAEAWGRWNASGRRHRPPRPGPLCPRLRPPGPPGRPPRPQHPPTTRQVRPDRCPGRRPATQAGVATTIPKTRDGQGEMIRVLGVARRGGRKARVVCRDAARALTSPPAATKTTLGTLARRWQQLQAELDRLDRQLQQLVTAGDHPSGSTPKPPSPTCGGSTDPGGPQAGPTATG